MSIDSFESGTNIPSRYGPARALSVPAALLSFTLLSTSAPTIAAHSAVVDDTARRPAVEAKAPNVVLGNDRSDLKALAQIRQLALYDDGWKGPDSVAATHRARQDAEQFARVLFSNPNVLMPRIGMAADGEISFYWKTPRVVANLGFVGDGTYSYFAKPPVGPSFADDAAPAGQALPKDLLRLLAADA